jgi:predicted phosphoadenosine phosphosulfate sulfurtransferase
MSAPTMVQTSLFDLMSGRERREVGMDLASAAQGTAWGTYAYGLLEGLAAELEEVHTDDLARVIEWHPRTGNSMGSVWRRAVVAGLIRKSGRTRPSKQPGKHAHDYPIYESLVFKGKGREAA